MISFLKQTLSKLKIIFLSERDYHQLTSDLKDPPEPNEKLIKLMKQYNFNLITGYPTSEDDCFNYYDGPKIFFEQDISGQLWFLYFAEDNMFMCFPVDSREDLRPMLDNQVPIRETLMARTAFLITWTDDKILSQPIDWSNPDLNQYLPNPDIFMFVK